VDRKEVKRAKAKRAAARRPPAFKLPPAPPATRRSFWFYLSCGAVFLLGFASLMLVIKNNLAGAGRALLLALIFAGWEYNFIQPAAASLSREEEFAAFTDLLAFSVVPGLLLYRLAFEHWGVLGLGGLFVITFSGVLRLSLYKIYNPYMPARGWIGFIGLPCAVTAAFAALLVQLLDPASLFPVFRLGLLMAVMGLSFLTVSTIRYPNPVRSPWILLLLVMAVGAIFYGAPVRLPAIYALLLSGAVYILLAPLGVRERRVEA
jgi:phosphatidylserine synthase